MCGCSYCSWTRAMDVPDSTEWLPCAAAGTMFYCRLADRLSSITAVRPDLHHSGRMARKVNDGQQGSRWSACSTWYASPHISFCRSNNNKVSSRSAHNSTSSTRSVFTAYTRRSAHQWAACSLSRWRTSSRNVWVAWRVSARRGGAG